VEVCAEEGSVGLEDIIVPNPKTSIQEVGQTKACGKAI